MVKAKLEPTYRKALLRMTEALEWEVSFVNMLTGCLLSEALYWPELIDIPVLLNRKVGVPRMSHDLIRLPHDLVRLWKDKGVWRDRLCCHIVLSMRPEEYCPRKDYEQITGRPLHTNNIMHLYTSSYGWTTQSHQEYQWIQVSALGESLGIIHPGLMLIMPRTHSQCPTSYTHTISPDDKVHADNVGGFVRAAVKHQCCSWLSPHIEAKLGRKW